MTWKELLKPGMTVFHDNAIKSMSLDGEEIYMSYKDRIIPVDVYDLEVKVRGDYEILCCGVPNVVLPPEKPLPKEGECTCDFVTQILRYGCQCGGN